MVKKETFVNRGYNAAALNAGLYFVIEDITNAEKQDNIPHNAFTIANLDTTCTLFLFLDNFSDQDTPDYVLQPTQTITVEEREGISFTTMFIKNTDAAANVAAKNIKYRISTIKEIKGSLYN